MESVQVRSVSYPLPFTTPLSASRSRPPVNGPKRKLNRAFLSQPPPGMKCYKLEGQDAIG